MGVYPRWRPRASLPFYIADPSCRLLRLAGRETRRACPSELATAGRGLSGRFQGFAHCTTQGAQRSLLAGWAARERRGMLATHWAVSPKLLPNGRLDGSDRTPSQPPPVSGGPDGPSRRLGGWDARSGQSWRQMLKPLVYVQVAPALPHRQRSAREARSGPRRSTGSERARIPGAGWAWNRSVAVC
jgi:hypothetical protein